MQEHVSGRDLQSKRLSLERMVQSVRLHDLCHFGFADEDLRTFLKRVCDTTAMPLGILAHQSQDALFLYRPDFIQPATTTMM